MTIKRLAVVLNCGAIGIGLLYWLVMGVQPIHAQNTCNVAANESIQSAINDTSCTIISISAGVYTETLTISRALTINGTEQEQTILNGTGDEPIVRITTNEPVVITDITIQNGADGGIYLSGSDLLLDEVAINNNQGGGLHIEGGAIVTINQSIFYSNTATAIFLDSDSTLTIRNSSLISNTGFASGGIAAQFDSMLTVDNTLFQGNVSGHEAGAITSITKLTVRNESRFIGNKGSCGGAIRAARTVSIEDATFEDNHATISGGAFCNLGIASINIDRVSIKNNRAGDIGGGIFTSGALTLSNALIQGNYAPEGGGLHAAGGVYDLVSVSKSAFVGNRATEEGGAISAADLMVDNVTFSDNQSNWDGSALYITDKLDMRRATIANNSNSTALALGFSLISATLQDVLFSNPTVENCRNDNSEYVTVTMINVLANDSTCTGVTIDPLVEPLADNGGNTLTHALQAASPALGTGTLCDGTDQRGYIRPSVGCDTGAFEDGAEIPTVVMLGEQKQVMSNRKWNILLSLTGLLGLTTTVIVQRKSIRH